jgi:hypothetical protein
MQHSHLLRSSSGSPLPERFLSRLVEFADLFTRPTWSNVLVLLAGVILAPGRRTVSAALRILGRECDPSSRQNPWPPIIPPLSRPNLDRNRTAAQLKIPYPAEPPGAPHPRQSNRVSVSAIAAETLKGTSNNCHRSSGASNLPANDSALFSFRFCAVPPKMSAIPSYGNYSRSP